MPKTQLLAVVLDWAGTVANEFRYKPGVANIYVIDREGRIIIHLTGPVTDVAEQELFHAIDRTIKQVPFG